MRAKTSRHLRDAPAARVRSRLTVPPTPLETSGAFSFKLSQHSHKFPRCAPRSSARGARADPPPRLASRLANPFLRSDARWRETEQSCGRTRRLAQLGYSAVSLTCEDVHGAPRAVARRSRASRRVIFRRRAPSSSGLGRSHRSFGRFLRLPIGDEPLTPSPLFAVTRTEYVWRRWFQR